MRTVPFITYYVNFTKLISHHFLLKYSVIDIITTLMSNFLWAIDSCLLNESFPVSYQFFVYLMSYFSVKSSTLCLFNESFILESSVHVYLMCYFLLSHLLYVYISLTTSCLLIYLNTPYIIIITIMTSIGC